MKEPAIVTLVRQGAALTPLQAVAAKLWRESGGDDPDGSLGRAIEAYWRARPGDDGYWAALSQRMSCDSCGETYKLENLSVCPNCFRVYCYRHGRDCSCGHAILG